MARLFLIELEAGRIYRCNRCLAHIVHETNYLLWVFQGRHGLAALFSRAVNYIYGEPRRQETTAGRPDQVVADIFCVRCGLYLGWKTVSDTNPVFFFIEMSSVTFFLLEVKLEGGGIYRCNRCRTNQADTHIAGESHLISRGFPSHFRDHYGPSATFTKAVNVMYGERRETRGVHQYVRDILCFRCGSILGWRNESDTDPLFVVEMSMVTDPI